MKNNTTTTTTDKGFSPMNNIKTLIDNNVEWKVIDSHCTDTLMYLMLSVNVEGENEYLEVSFTLKVKDTVQNLRYDLMGSNGKFTTVNLYSLANSATPLFVYTCDSTGDTSCLSKVTLTMGSPSTLVFNNMKFRGVYQTQYDEIMNGQVTLNP